MIVISSLFLLLVILCLKEQYIIKAFTIKSSRITNINRILMLVNDNDDDRPKLQLQDDNDKPRISIEEKVIDKPKPFVSTSIKPQRTERTTATFGSLSVEDLKSRMVQRDAPQLALPQRTEDLNGINPVTPLVFSTVAIAMSFVAWQISAYLSAHFAIDYVTSEIYPVQRLAIVSRNIVVGISTLASGFSGVVAIGLILLGITVGVGVAKGELDPTPKDAPPQ